MSSVADARLASAFPAGKIGRVMVALALPHVRRWSDVMLTRPLSLSEALIIAAVLLGAGTVYCQIYCLLALQQMGGASMPLLASVHRASVDVLPAFAAFELSKRITLQRRIGWWLAVVLVFAVAVAAAVIWRMEPNIMASGLSPRRVAVDRIPFMALAAAGVGYFHIRRRIGTGRSPWQRVSDEPDTMPPPKAIEWVKAAGNYVELQVGGRTRLIRMTLRQAAAMLPDDQFVQIHRSVIVNRQRIVTTHGRSRVKMSDGAEFRVGDAYRSHLSSIRQPPGTTGWE